MELGRFEVIEELGKGGFGIVYKARDKVLNRQVALKVLHPELLINPDFISRFKHEAQLSAQLDHPNLLPIYDFGEFEGRYYIVMAYMPAGSLKDLLKKEGALDKQRSLKIFEEVCEGLEYAHSQKIIHRDLKPGNILFDNRGKACISDMGFAKLIHSDSSSSLSASGGMVGTPAYMAPEIWRSKQATSATDVYSLACVLVEMMTGEALFAAESTPEVMLKHFEPLQLPDGLPEEWKPVLEAALEKKPEDRIQTVRDFFEQIKAVELGLNEAEKEEPKKTDESKVREEKQTSESSENEQSKKSGEGIHGGDMDAQDAMHSKFGFAEDPDKEEKKPVSAENNEKKVKLGVVAGIALLAIILGVIIYQIGKTNSPSPAPVIVEVPVTVTATNTALIPTKTATATKAPTKTATKTPAPTVPVLGIGSTQIREIDGMEQVYVPAGEFIMGSDDSDADSDEKPVRTVYLDAYWIDKYEVTNGQYKKCVDDGACSAVSTYGATENHPVRGITWHEAKTYCEWVDGDKGGLPTEAQWEKAARGTDGRKYPWGNDAPDNNKAHYNKEWITGPVVVGSKPEGASFYGAEDMAGNVWEWVNDWYSSSYYASSPDSNPQGPSGTREYRVLRGGSWGNVGRYIRSAYRSSNNPNIRLNYIGFRCFSSP